MPGLSTQTETLPCVRNPCPYCTWTNFTVSGCSSTCNTGFRLRSRQCLTGSGQLCGTCDGSDVISEVCTDLPACPGVWLFIYLVDKRNKNVFLSLSLSIEYRCMSSEYSYRKKLHWLWFDLSKSKWYWNLFDTNCWMCLRSWLFSKWKQWSMCKRMRLRLFGFEFSVSCCKNSFALFFINRILV